MSGRSLRAAAVLFAAGAVGPTAAGACSMAAGYRVPTNLELAARAETIVVATITGERKGKEPWDGAVLTRPVTLLKGPKLPEKVELGGAYLAADERSRRMVAPSDPRELRAPNPGAMIGGCVRYIFAPGMRLVLFLERGKGGRLVPIRSSFSRDAEDVSGQDALWVKAVREYAGIGAAPRAEWPARLRARAAALRAAGDADSMAIAADMVVELSGERRAPYD